MSSPSTVEEQPENTDLPPELIMSSFAGAGFDQYEISDLPPEIFPKIVKYLSVNERKAVKLVCKSWFKYCNVHSLLNDEVLTCKSIYQLSDIYKLLGQSERKFLNLRFEYVKFDEGSSFWNNNGPRIRSIEFEDCQFPNGILEEIIISCENLFHLSLEYTAYLQYIIKDRDSLPPISDLERIAEKGIVRENLNSLDIYIINSHWFRLSDYILHQLFLIFPKVKILKVTSDFYPAEKVDFNLTELPNRNRLTMSPVMNYLIASTERIEELKLYFSSAFFSPNSLRRIFETVTSLKRLEELSINLGSTIRQEDVEILLDFKPLKSFIFSRWTSAEPLSFEPFLSNSDLEHLEVWAAVDSSIAVKPLFRKLTSSGLKNCKIVIKNSVLTQDSDSSGSLFVAENRPITLPNLSVRIHRSGPWKCEGEMVEFLQHFQYLRHLLIDDISFNELQSLLKYQTKLKSLTLKEEGQLKVMSPDYVDVFQDAFNQLTDLEYLELSPPVAYIFLSSLSPGSILPNLKYLKISLSTYTYNTILPTDLQKLADATPILEGLYVHDCGSTPFDLCLKLCSKLSRLRFLRWDRYQVNEPFCTDELFRRVFFICPSLRLLFYSSNFEYVYFYDILNKRTLCVLQNDDVNKPYTFAKPRIDGYTVTWLTFSKRFYCENKRFY